jgi:hypothetical protein
MCEWLEVSRSGFLRLEITAGTGNREKKGAAQN